MRSRNVFGWVGLLLFCAAVAGRNQPNKKKQEEQGYTIRTTSRLVLLDVSVKDAAGGFVSGLTKDNFKVYENGKPQEINEFANADIPVTAGIVVDESGRLRPKQTQVIAGAG